MLSFLRVDWKSGVTSARDTKLEHMSNKSCGSSSFAFTLKDCSFRLTAVASATFCNVMGLVEKVRNVKMILSSCCSVEGMLSRMRLYVASRVLGRFSSSFFKLGSLLHFRSSASLHNFMVRVWPT